MKKLGYLAAVCLLGAGLYASCKSTGNGGSSLQSDGIIGETSWVCTTEKAGIFHFWGLFGRYNYKGPFEGLSYVEGNGSVNIIEKYYQFSFKDDVTQREWECHAYKFQPSKFQCTESNKPGAWPEFILNCRMGDQ